jgi:hypothetical protein
MAVRIKSQWHKENRGRSTEEIAGAIAFNCLKLAIDKAMNLHTERFRYDSPEQHLGVIIEYLIFQAQIVDRLAYGRLDDAQRQPLIVALARRLAEHVQNNGVESCGPGEYGASFIERFNQRSAEYAELGFTEDGPSYPFLRHLGYQIQRLMGESQENRWVIDQVMDQDAPEVYRQLKRALLNMI